jgi:hypothetical protein
VQTALHIFYIEKQYRTETNVTPSQLNTNPSRPVATEMHNMQTPEIEQDKILNHTSRIALTHHT